MSGRLGIDDVAPVVSCDRYPSKAVVGEHVPIAATVWREGHDAVAATVVWRGPGEQLGRPVRMTDEGNDCFGAVVVPDREGLWSFRVDAWADPWASWRPSRSPGPRHTTVAATASWPSRHTVAAIGTCSPTTALDG